MGLVWKEGDQVGGYCNKAGANWQRPDQAGRAKQVGKVVRLWVYFEDSFNQAFLMVGYSKERSQKGPQFGT